MTDKKISELTALTGAALADTDLIPVVDTSATTTKKISLEELKIGLDTPSGFIRKTGGTFSGAIDVTGTVTADGLTVEGTTATFGGASGEYKIIIEGSAAPRQNYIGMTGYDSLVIAADEDNLGVASDIQFRVDAKQVAAFSAGGDISFYEDTGTTPKFFWDASDERLSLTGSDYQFGIQQGANQPWYHRAISNGKYALHLNGSGDVMTLDTSGNVGIGTSSPTSDFDVRGESVFGSGTDGVKLTYSAGNSTGIIDTGFTSTGLEFRTGNSFAAIIDPSGNVGIGVVPSTLWSSSYDALQVGLGGSMYAHAAAGSNMHMAANSVYEGTAPNYYDKYLTSSTASKYVQDSGLHIWSTAASGTAGDAITWSEAMRIDSSGNVGIGTSSPDTELHIEDATGNAVVQIESSAAGYSAVFLGDVNDGDVGQIRYDHSDNSMRFGTNATAEVMRITSTGDLSLTGGGGIIFTDAGGSGIPTSNTLDDYEEGTWTATIGCSGNGTTTTTKTGYYTKVGRKVTAAFRNLDDIDTTGLSGFLSVTLPFNCVTADVGFVGGVSFDNLVYPANVIELKPVASNGATAALFSLTGDNVNLTFLGATAPTSGTTDIAYFTITYFTA